MRCAACGLPAHRYGRNEGADRFDPMACVNQLRGVLEGAEEVWWCRAHDSTALPGSGARPSSCLYSDIEDAGICDMVRGRVLTEEGT